MKRPLTIHNDTAHTALQTLQLFSQQPSSGDDPHEHDTMHDPNKQLILIIWRLTSFIISIVCVLLHVHSYVIYHRYIDISHLAR